MTKLNHYEDNYQKRVENARQEELKKLSKELFVWALSMVLTVISPILASSATFILYVLMDESHILTAAETFTVLLLFNALRFPINYFGRLLGRLAQALTSLDRIAEFLDREVRDTENLLQSANGDDGPAPPSQNKDDALLTVRNASFRIGSPESPETSASSAFNEMSKGFNQGGGFEVSGIDFEVHRGQILALVGAVGTGKSTIVNGIIGEVFASSSTSISMKGKVAYVSQHAFILNTTLRENVLFGEPYDQDRYESVLEACCLWPDIELLGGGDLTEIGEPQQC